MDTENLEGLQAIFQSYTTYLMINFEHDSMTFELPILSVTAEEQWPPRDYATKQSKSSN